MGALVPILGAVSTIAGVAGTMMDVSGKMEEGREAKARYQYEQKVDAQQADEAVASSQRDAREQYRQGQLLMSQQRAAIAGSGGDMSDPSVIKLMDDTAERTAYAGESEIYKGDQQARGYNDAAKVAGYNASSAMRAARISAAGSLFKGVSSIFSRFGENSAARTKQPTSTIIKPF